MGSSVFKVTKVTKPFLKDMQTTMRYDQIVTPERKRKYLEYEVIYLSCLFSNVLLSTIYKKVLNCNRGDLVIALNIQ